MRTKKEIIASIYEKDRINTTYIHPTINSIEIARYISAYANGNGGDLIFGIKDDGRTLIIKNFVFKLKIEEVLELLNGNVKIEYDYIYIEDHKLFYISIDKADELIKVKDIPYTVNKDGDIEEMKIKKVFISYSHKDSDLVNIIEDQLSEYEDIEIGRDIKITEYRDSLDEFMKTIRNYDFVISVVTSEYIKSLNCMYEITQLMKDRDYQKKLFFIVVGKGDVTYYKEENVYEGFEANIYNARDRLKYITYWRNEEKVLDREIREADLPLELMVNITEDKRKLNSIMSSMDDFIKLLSDKVGRSFKDMYKNDFKEILDVINE
ncbi:TIR domain-containing protein [Planococcus sp. 107-1]|uniref:TIR domain-containing protein n=1 Tax=Planococcus sp. 107-1 TaxID=2908840 RepID=UPI001F16BB49|nr:TIR domain-containing protein [Planococcus sp. 107-1]UJF27953.1 TIR domain-containing protein [Planococcus sp. 107-1]